MTGDIQGPSGMAEAQFLADLGHLGLTYRTIDAGPIQAVVPSSRVRLDAGGQVTTSGT